MIKLSLSALDKKYSVTFAGVIAMILSQVLQRLNITVAPDALTITVSTVLFIGGALLTIWGRWRKGDVNIFGFKK